MLWKFKLKKQNLIEVLSEMPMPRDVLQLIEISNYRNSNYRSSIVFRAIILRNQVNILWEKNIGLLFYVSTYNTFV